MEIEISLNTFTINGNIKNPSHFQNIKNNMDIMIKQHSNIIVNIVDSISITSSVIIYLNNLILKDNITIIMMVQDPQLLRLLDDLNLMKVFNVREVGKEKTKSLIK